MSKTILAAKNNKRRSRRLSVEKLEDRRMLATTYVILDYTPDSHAGSFADTFYNTKLPGGQYAPSFLDFNRDGRVNQTDVTAAAQQISNKVAAFYGSAASGYDVRFQYGDITSNTNWGTQWINWGKYDSNAQVSVMYFGGTNKGGSPIGMAPVASPGYNFEGYGETYTRALANWMVTYRKTAASSEFVDRVAQVAAHELGHMYGLQHPTADMQNNVMNSSQPNNAGAAMFLNQNVYTVAGWQNAYAELRNSFRGQPQQWNSKPLGGQWSMPTSGAAPSEVAAGARATVDSACAVDSAILNFDWNGVGELTAEGARAQGDIFLALAVPQNQVADDLAAIRAKDTSQIEVLKRQALFAAMPRALATKPAARQLEDAIPAVAPASTDTSAANQTRDRLFGEMEEGKIGLPGVAGLPRLNWHQLPVAVENA